MDIEWPLHSLNDRAAPRRETDSLEDLNGIDVKATSDWWTWKGGDRADAHRIQWMSLNPSEKLPETSDKRPQNALSHSVLTSRCRRSGTSPMIILEM